MTVVSLKYGLTAGSPTLPPDTAVIVSYGPENNMPGIATT